MKKGLITVSAVFFLLVSGSQETAAITPEDFKDIFEKHGSIMMLVDAKDGSIVYANPSASKFYGYPSEVLLNMRVQDISLLSEKEVEAERSAAAREERNYFIFPHRTAEGEIKVVEVYSWPFEMNGRQTLFSIIHDVTEKAEAEKLLFARTRYFTTGLLVLVLVLSGVVIKLGLNINKMKKMHKDLRKAKDQAESAVKAKSIFLSNMSHEIRTPMNGILGFLQLLNESPLNAEQKEYLQHVEESSRSLLSIINEILDITRLELGKIRIKEEPFDISQSIKETAQGYMDEAEKKGLSLIVDIKNNLPETVFGDSMRFVQILEILINNAAKYTEKGEVKIEAGLSSETADNIEIYVKVKDTGPGMSKDFRKIIFTPFSQGDDSSTRVHGGTGLGLAICKEIVNLMGGRISYLTEEGRGSEFSIEIPFKKP